mmetsp:Transcript_98555/g.234727  ORF Transcript_98555/g.234727 Transcript_98555/m.234727 type:complete len:283 (+) Transcript_98555:208-1056(+)
MLGIHIAAQAAARDRTTGQGQGMYHVSISGGYHSDPHDLFLDAVQSVHISASQRSGRESLGTGATSAGDHASFALLCTFGGDGQPISEVYLSFLQSDVGIHVTTDHSTVGSGDAAEAFSAEDVAVHAGHLCWACSLQCEGAQLQRARCLLRQWSYRASSGEIPHSRKAPVHLPPDGFCNSAVLHGSVGSHVANFDYVIHGGRRALVLATDGVRPTRVGARWRRRRSWRWPSSFSPDAFRLERVPPKHRQLSGNLLHQPCHSSSSWQCQELPLHCRLSGDFQE